VTVVSGTQITATTPAGSAGAVKRGDLAVGPTKRGKDTRILAICTDHSLPLAVSIKSASPRESQLVNEVLGQSFLDELPERLIGDAAYNSDPSITICWKPTISS